MGGLSLDVCIERHPLAAPFRISGYVFENMEMVVVTLSDGILRGRGEASGIYYLGEDAENMLAQIESHRDIIEAGATREELRALMPSGGARNALDCALWELEAVRARRPVWELAGIGEPRPLLTTFTVGADTPGKMAEGARAYAEAKSIKLKLTGELELDVGRVRAVRAELPEVWIGVDANQGFTIGNLDALVGAMVEARVSLIEQPLARGSEADLEGYKSPIPIAADESALGIADLPRLVGRFQIVNIKLDKCGGLTEALAMADLARRLGLGVMVGNMVGTSLAMAPAFIVGQLCDLVDLDGPLFLKQDRQPSAVYRDGEIWCGDEIWGFAAQSVQ